jgi:HEAT repeat protein
MVMPASENGAMPAKSHWGMTPQQSVQQECGRRGAAEVVAGCVRLLTGCDADSQLVYAIGGPAADSVLGPHPRQDQRYFLRVWGARALLYAWDDCAPGPAAAAVIAALDDESWRVREMAAKVVAKRKLGDALTAVAKLCRDPVPRVQAAAERATAILTVARA